jgi:hypothetical protein
MISNRHSLFRLAWLTAVLIAVAPASSGRSAFTAESPDWLRAVGKLTVPGQELVDGERRSREENCSATLVGPATILTAWHCLEYYRDLSHDPMFSLPNVPQQKPLPARRLADGGGMHADWALLRLQKPVRSVVPIAIIQYPVTSSPVSFLLAGFARDAGPGNGGQALTWEQDCRQIVNEGYRVGVDCVTHRGASGGPILAQGKLVGVVSAGDRETTTYFAPSSLFIASYRLHRR